MGVAEESVRRYRDNLLEERNAVALYEALSALEKQPELSTLYKRLAETERRHAMVWARKLTEAGVPVPESGIDWRTRTLIWLARRFGVGFVLPTIAGIEQGAGSRYDQQPEVNTGRMPKDEHSHARLFKMLSGAGGLDGNTVARAEGRHRSTGGNALRAGVLGANDGLVSVLSLVMGVAGAAMDAHAIVVAGLAGMLAGAISMAMGEWLSVQSSRELFSRQLAIEQQELAESPEEEKEELALIYQSKGLSPAMAKQFADELLSNPAHALDTLSREELGMDPDEGGGSAWVAAGTSFLLFVVGAVIPLAPFLFVSGTTAVAWSCLSSTVGLFVIGAGITLVTGRSIWLSGLRQIMFGLGAAAVTYGIGRLVGVKLGG